MAKKKSSSRISKSTPAARTKAAAGVVKRPFRHALDGKAIVMLFEKPSLRTRVSFEVGINKLGGTAIYMDHGKQRLGERESVKDYALNLERWVECIVARVYLQTVLEEWPTRRACR
jgi:ornithine carbamoyltransferase